MAGAGRERRVEAALLGGCVGSRVLSGALQQGEISPFAPWRAAGRAGTLWFHPLF